MPETKSRVHSHKAAGLSKRKKRRALAMPDIHFTSQEVFAARR
jgi:hypothetical protein